MVQEEEMTEKLETLPGLQFCPFQGASTGSALWRERGQLWFLFTSPPLVTFHAATIIVDDAGSDFEFANESPF